MRYGIFSDIHSNLEALEAVLAAYKSEKIDQYLCVGDVVGYAANPRECIAKVMALVVVTVAGNHDWASVNLFPTDYFNPTARSAVLWTERQLDDEERHFLASLKLVYKNKDLTLVHGTLDSPGDFNYLSDGFIAEESFGLLETKLCFVGHTHIAGIFIKDKSEAIEYRQEDTFKIEEHKQYIINVGSVGQPRDGNPAAAYCIYDTEKKEVQIKRIGYDYETAREKIISAGLPRFLGDRLIMGR